MGTLFLSLMSLLPLASDFLVVEPLPPAAMVLSSRGQVTVERGSEKPRRLGAMDILRPGDRLHAAADGEALLVMLGDGHRERVKAKGEALVGDKGCTPDNAVERQEHTSLSAGNLACLQELARSGRGTVGVARDLPPPMVPVVAPLYGATVLTPRPTLSWLPVAGAAGYQVQLLSGGQGKDQQLLWKATTPETHLAYPAKEKPLCHGLTYRWRVLAQAAEGPEKFVVLSKFQLATEMEIDQLAQVKPLGARTPAADLLLWAVLLEAHGVHDQALVLYEQLAQELPAEANVQMALANYYERAGRKEEAGQARERAKQLGYVFPGKGKS